MSLKICNQNSRMHFILLLSDLTVTGLWQGQSFPETYWGGWEIKVQKKKKKSGFWLHPEFSSTFCMELIKLRCLSYLSLTTMISYIMGKKLQYICPYRRRFLLFLRWCQLEAELGVCWYDARSFLQGIISSVVEMESSVYQQALLLFKSNIDNYTFN